MAMSLKIRIVSSIPDLGASIAAALGRGDLTCDVDTSPTSKFELRYRADLPPATLAGLLAHLQPLTPAVTPRDDWSSGKDGVDAELHLGHRKGIDGWGVRVVAEDVAMTEAIRGPLLGMGLGDHGTDTAPQEHNVVAFDKAPLLTRQIVRWQLAQLGVVAEEQRQRGLGASIRVHFARQDGRRGSPPPFHVGWFAEPTDAPLRPLLDVDADGVRIGGLRLPRREAGLPLVPPQAHFEHFCFDQRTAETLHHVAQSVALGEPCLLEGETSVSKTSIVQLLASLLGQPLVRLNLNGQTDTGELVGRFLPRDGSAELPIDADALRASAELLEPESRAILDRAAAEGRDLNPVEIQQVVANERIRTHPWKWHDGLVVSAMRHGWWVVLDELNLAEPQILERLNSLLEREPSLVLTEHDNTVLGPGGVPIHPSFRIFATMNPAEYAGRSALSPAYRDRWRGYRFVQAPSEADYHAMLAFLVTGRQPEVWLRGRPYVAAEVRAPYAALASVPQIDAFLVALARFHAALESAVRDPSGTRASLGVRRQERYVFTRRGLLAVMDCLTGLLDIGTAPEEAMRVALTRYYLDRVAAQDDREVVGRLLDAAGIGAQTWTVGA
jgi:MoxR-like ATPase